MVDLLDYSVSVIALSEGAWSRWREDGWVKIASAACDEWREAFHEALATHTEAVREILDPDNPDEAKEKAAMRKWDKVQMRLFARFLLKESRNLTAGEESIDLSDEETAYQLLSQDRHRPFWLWCQDQANNSDRFTEKNIAEMAKNFDAACSGISNSEEPSPAP